MYGFVIGHRKFFSMLGHEKPRETAEYKSLEKENGIISLTKHILDIIKYLQLLTGAWTAEHLKPYFLEELTNEILSRTAEKDN